MTNADRVAPLARLRDFLGAMTRLVSAEGATEERILAQGRPLLAELVRHDDWLPDMFARPDPRRYMQYLLYCDPLARFSVVSFVWGPGQTTPIHDHTVWGLIGMLRGAEESERYAPGRPPTLLGRDRLEPGMTEAVSPAIGDVHRVRNALADRVSISIHVYGADIGAVRRHAFDARSGAAKAFVSGYANAVPPNPWRADA